MAVVGDCHSMNFTFTLTVQTLCILTGCVIWELYMLVEEVCTHTMSFYTCVKSHTVRKITHSVLKLPVLHSVQITQSE